MHGVQDRYVADIGDFGKYALLNALAGDDLRLGVHWYRNSDEEANRDGKFTDYPRLRECDPLLHDALNDIVCSGRRCISAVESASILPGGTVFYSLPLSSRDAEDPASRSRRRAEWNVRALEYVFPHLGLSSKRQSLVLYHHQTREKGGLAATLPLKFKMLRSLGFEEAWAFVFRRVSVRVYFILPAPPHVAILAKRSASFLNTHWGLRGHFQLVRPGRS